MILFFFFNYLSIQYIFKKRRKNWSSQFPSQQLTDSALKNPTDMGMTTCLPLNYTLGIFSHNINLKEKKKKKSELWTIE